MQLRVAPRDDKVAEVRRAVCDAALAAGVPPQRCEDIAIAVSEAVTNAVRAHIRSGSHDELTVEWTRDGGAFTVAVIDRGPGFVPISPEQAAATAIRQDGQVIGGLGVTLIRALADDVRFVRTGTGMRVAMSFALPAGDRRGKRPHSWQRPGQDHDGRLPRRLVGASE